MHHVEFSYAIITPHHPDRTGWENMRNMKTTFKNWFSLLFLRGGVSITVKLCEVGKPIILWASFKKIKIIDLENIDKQQMF